MTREFEDSVFKPKHNFKMLSEIHLRGTKVFSERENGVLAPLFLKKEKQVHSIFRTNSST
jgi:hypothetical protein